MTYFEPVYMGVVLASESTIGHIEELLNIQGLTRRLKTTIIPPSLESKVEIPYQTKVNPAIPYQCRTSFNYLPWNGFYPRVDGKNRKRSKIYAGRYRGVGERIRQAREKNKKVSITHFDKNGNMNRHRIVSHVKYSTLFR